jgi:methyl-accepting chemotaxis protein
MDLPVVRGTEKKIKGHQMTISKKLLITLCLSMLALICVGMFGVWNLGQSQDRFQYVMTNTMPSLRCINKARSALTTIRVSIRAMLIETTQEAKEKNISAIDAANKKFDEAIADYQANDISNDQDRQLLEADKAAMVSYRTTVQSIIDADKAGQHDKAITMIRGAAQIAATMTNALDEHYKFNEDLATQFSAENQAAYASSLLLSFVSIGVALIIVGFLSAVIYRAIRDGFAQLSSNLTQVSHSLDFRIRAEVKSNDEVGHANRAFNQLLDKLQSSFKTLVEVANEVGSASKQLMETSKQVSTASAAQSEASANMAATVEEMTVSINHVAEQARATQAGAEAARTLVGNGSNTIRQTIDDIHQISAVVKESVESIRELEADSTQVGSVIGAIRDIADQTNLLALNAAIEAARAGEQGRGFAVVADEVRKLAERTAKATLEISSTISAMIDKSKTATEQMEKAGNLVDTGVSRADEANNAIAQIGDNVVKASSSISEISSAIQQQGVASNNIAMQVEQTAQMAEESSAAAGQTADSARHLDALVQRQTETLAAFRV